MKDLYRIFNIEKSEYGKPFALCGVCFEEWEAKDRLIVETIGENSDLPCNNCGI